MVLKFISFFIFVVCSANRNSFAVKEQVKGNAEECFINTDQGREAEGDESYNFPEFEKMAEFIRPLIKHVENHKCKNQLETLVESLKNSSLWAVQMIDASTKTPNGLLTSDAYELGNYDACVEINLKRTEEDNILGKYCLIVLSTKKPTTSHSRDEYVPEIQLWEKLMVSIFKYGFISNLCRSAVCVPNECLPKDIENVFRFLFNKTSRKLKREIEISVPEYACSIANVDESTGVTYVKKVTPLAFLWVAVITIFDLLGWFPKSENVWLKLLTNFSAYKNYKILTSTDCCEPLGVVNCLKVYAVILLVIIRRISFFLAGPIMNRKYVDQVFDESFKESFFHISNNIIADTFLVLDGFLHFHRTFSYYRKNPKINICRVYIFHLLNTCPLYITAILFYGYVFETVGTGPMWKEKTGNLVKNCKENWVINLMNLNNFLKVNDMCIFESWHFAVVAQCFVIVPVLAKITQKASTSGRIVFKLLIITVFALPAAHFYYSLESFDNESGDVYWHTKLSMKTTDRAGAYFIGILSSLGYLWTKEKFKFLKIYGKTPFRVAFGVFFLGLCFELNSQIVSPLQKAYIFSSRQIIWCLFISYVVLGISTKRLTGIAPLINRKCLIPLGRLSFSYILVLDFIQVYSVGIMRTLDYFSLSRMVWISCADLLATYAVAFIFYMIVHRPVSNVLHETFM